MKLKIKEGTTSKLIRVFIVDSSKTDGSGLTGVVFGDITCYWIAEGDATVSSLSLQTMTVGTWIAGGFKEIDATNMPGWYELGLSDNIIDATSEGSVGLMLKGAANMAPVNIEIELDTIDYRVSGGMLSTDVSKIDGNATAATKLKSSALGIIAGTAQGGPHSTTVMSTDLTGYQNDELIGRVVVWTGGVANGQASTITDYISAAGTIVFEPITTPPSDLDTFVIV